MTPHEQAKALADELGIAVDDLRRAITVLGRSIATTQTLAYDARRLADFLYPEPPARRTILEGPNFDPSTVGRSPTPEEFYAAFGRDRVEHGTHGMGTNTVVSPTEWRHHTRGGGQSIVEDRSQIWFDIPDTNDVEVSYEFMFAADFDWGWQAKFGVGVESHHSGQAWPGGGTLHDPDWSWRDHWNQYKRLPQNPLRFGGYLYSTRLDKDRLLGQVWSSVAGEDGWRRLALFNDITRPVAGQWQRHTTRIVRGPSNGNTSIAVMINGEVVWSEACTLLSPANRVYFVDGYGGTDASEGPNRPTDIHYRNVKVTVP